MGVASVIFYQRFVKI